MQERNNYGVIHNIRLTLTLQFLWLSSVTTIRSHALRCISVHTSHRYLTPIITPDSPSACTCTRVLGQASCLNFLSPAARPGFMVPTHSAPHRRAARSKTPRVAGTSNHPPSQTCLIASQRRNLCVSALLARFQCALAYLLEMGHTVRAARLAVT